LPILSDGSEAIFFEKKNDWLYERLTINIHILRGRNKYYSEWRIKCAIYFCLCDFISLTIMRDHVLHKAGRYFLYTLLI